MMDDEGYIIEDTEMNIQEDTQAEFSFQPENVDPREAYEAGMHMNKPDESLLEWFDRAVESELEKHRLSLELTGQTLSLSQGIGHHSVLEGAASGVDIMSNLAGQPDTELTDAVEKFAKAEAIVAFEGAVRAAEEAAANAPPGMAEEAAAAGARGYQAELTGVVKDRVPGDRPIEVIGYVGITRPKNPKQSKSHKH